MITQNRRRFLQTSAVAAGGLVLPRFSIGQDKPSKKLNFAAIGVGGKGDSDLAHSAELANIVAICDVDRRTLARAQAKYPDAKAFESYKEMFETMGDKIDGVTISTPDHAHFPAAMMAISRGIHVCVQKPLVNRISEANALHQAARKKGVKTNMGNQGHTGEGIRRLKEWVAAGMVGKVKEVHVWTNRPIWPQGSKAKAEIVPAEAPDYLNWQAWLAQCPDIPYHQGLHDFKWRGHMEYGSGAVGDMCCHLADGPFWALDLGEPYKLEGQCEDLTDVTWPVNGRVECHFKTPAHGDVKLTWYEGGLRPERPAALEESRKWEAKGGFLIVGEEGTIMNTDDYCSSPRMIPEEKFKAWMKDNEPQKTLERCLSPGNPQKELILAIEQDKICGSNFDYAVPLTKFGLLANLAIGNPGKVIEWDEAAQKVTSVPEANKMLPRAAVRPGWDFTA